ncbi:MAG: DUF3303 family protein, partial [Rhodothermales bacterium]|nr:DUF3303 family protein [Rhodothermales bacterium]
MKFMIRWEAHPDKRLDVLKTWCDIPAEQRTEMGPGVNFIGRWHNLPEFTGTLVVETDDIMALSVYLSHWSPVMDLEVSAVLDDEESVAAGKALL